MSERAINRALAATSNTRENRLRVLTHIADLGLEARIEPVASVDARIGYTYPEVCKTIQCKPGQDLDLLESLAEAGCLSRELLDKVDLCPYCLHGSLRLRRLCPYCRSSLIIRKEVLHHFRCGWVGIEDEAEHGTDLMCPKCKKHLRHIGVDYERASESHYCTTCEKIFAQPLEEFLSIPCGRQIPKDGIMIHPVFVYRMTQNGEEAVAKQSFDGVQLQKGIVEHNYNLYTREYMATRLHELVNRYLRYRAGFSVALVSIDHFSELVRDQGHLEAATAVKLMAAIIKGETRGVDLPGLFDDHTFILLLPQTDYKGAQVFAKRYVERIRGARDASPDAVPSVSVAIAGCPEDGEDAETVMAKLIERIEACQSKGGNTIEGP
jgi:diguanylate cyclase (GGDEF)-like protein